MEYLGIIQKELCTGCSACLNTCPVGCIKMNADEKGFRYPFVDRNQCIGCHQCEIICPVLTSEGISLSNHSSFLGCKHKDDRIRRGSSSGGVFYALAQRVLSNGGIVFGARFSEDFHKVIHVGVDTIEELDPIRISKYVQSEVESVFPEVLLALRSGRMVLFSGTPCQVAGLKAFLHEPFESLILVDIVCHGVPSQKIWDYYLTGLEREYSAKAVRVSFRDKTSSWHRSDFKVVFDNGSSFSQSNSENPYMQSYLRNLNLRPSCANCSFKHFNSGSDLTLGDFWGSSEVSCDYSDDIGISVVAVHTKKGEQIIESICSELKDVIPLNEKEAYVFNESYCRSSLLHKDSDLFFDGLGSISFPLYVSSFPQERLRKADKKGLLKQILRRLRAIFCV